MPWSVLTTTEHFRKSYYPCFTTIMVFWYVYYFCLFFLSYIFFYSIFLYYIFTLHSQPHGVGHSSSILQFHQTPTSSFSYPCYLISLSIPSTHFSGHSLPFLFSTFIFILTLNASLTSFLIT